MGAPSTVSTDRKLKLQFSSCCMLFILRALPFLRVLKLSCRLPSLWVLQLWTVANSLAEALHRRFTMVDQMALSTSLSSPTALMGRNLYVNAEPPPDLNKNTAWFQYPGVWTSYILLLFLCWLLALSILGCSPGTAWSIVNLSHFATDLYCRKRGVVVIFSKINLSGYSFSIQITYWSFHWRKGTPFAEDQGMYNKLTWWEQMDNGRQLTRNRKFLMVVPVVLYLIACHTTDYSNPWLVLNTIAAFILVIAKLPNMHKVRIFGINADYPT
ncbi:hypothetical protein L7F22_058856 [Adiantum nelumboides]|nr:hypothetical protein [Adiantum nelumboides]